MFGWRSRSSDTEVLQRLTAIETVVRDIPEQVKTVGHELAELRQLSLRSNSELAAVKRDVSANTLGLREVAERVAALEQHDRDREQVGERVGTIETQLAEREEDLRFAGSLRVERERERQSWIQFRFSQRDRWLNVAIVACAIVLLWNGQFLLRVVSFLAFPQESMPVQKPDSDP